MWKQLFSVKLGTNSDLNIYKVTITKTLNDLNCHTFLLLMLPFCPSLFNKLSSKTQKIKHDLNNTDQMKSHVSALLKNKIYHIHVSTKRTVTYKCLYQGKSLIICPNGSLYKANRKGPRTESFRWGGEVVNRNCKIPIRVVGGEPLQGWPRRTHPLSKSLTQDMDVPQHQKLHWHPTAPAANILLCHPASWYHWSHFCWVQQAGPRRKLIK